MLKALFGLEGKRMIVLGGGLGMGEATSKLLADLGCHVAVLDIIPERAERVAAEVSAKGVRGLPVVCDVTDDDALVAALARTERDFGPLDGMATIVGMSYMTPRSTCRWSSGTPTTAAICVIFSWPPARLRAA